MLLIRWLEKYCSLLTLGFLALIAYFQARGTALLVAAAIDGPPRRAPPIRSPLLVAHRRSADAILQRNPFDSITGPLDVRAPTPVRVLDNANPLAAPECDSPQVVIVTELRQPAWSVAALRAMPDSAPRNRRVGDRIAGKTVEFIGYNPAQSAPAVWLSSAAGLCQTLLFKPPSQTASALTSPRSAPPAEAALGALEPSLLRQVRLVPERKAGTIIGLRLFGIRAGSLLGLLGLENGDRLESINGLALGTPEQALAAYARLFTATRLNVEIDRRGRPLTLGYRVD